MKKKKRGFLALILCATLLCCVACTRSESQGVTYLEGTKVLSRPSDFNFAQAVGSNASQYYYNIFARGIVNSLYEVYESDSVLTRDLSEDGRTKREWLYGNLSGDGFTYSVTKDTSANAYYLYDSIRYTITRVSTYRKSDGTVTKQELTLNPNTDWNWSVGGDTVFNKLQSEFSSVTVNGNDVTITGSEWTSPDFIRTDLFPSFGEYYTGIRHNVAGKDDVINYYDSPFYQTVVEGSSSASAVNFYQDAMEYAVYMFVLGYDYVNDAGAILTDGQGRLFDFVVKTDGYGRPSGMTVKGWDADGSVNTDNTTETPIEKALGYAKDLYQSTGVYIGITTTAADGQESNKDQIVRFVKDKVIGTASPDTFTIQMNAIQVNDEGNPGASQPTNQKFNRHYDQIISNIVDFACSEAPIGEYTDEQGNKHKLSLDNPYLASTITDYEGSYFFMDYSGVDENGEPVDDDGHMFKNIAPAEYQSIILMPDQLDVLRQKPLTDIWLAFEYWDDPEDSFEENGGLVRADSISIDVGFRFFDNSTGEYLEFEPYTIEVKNGKYDSFGGNPDENWVYICDYESEADIYLDKEKPIIYDTTNGMFKNDIGNNAINPREYGTAISPFIYTMSINGTTNAREFFKMNNSSHGGMFGTLNPDKFTGAQGCDYAEIYFDIHKEAGKPNTNYAFKVGLTEVEYVSEN